MKRFSFNSLFARSAKAAPWTCKQDIQKSQWRIQTPQQAFRYSTRSKAAPGFRSKKAIVLLAATGSAGVGALAFTDDLKHGYQAVERTGRVVSTLFICINE
jgi:aarF domain-containing kinase